MDSLGHRALRQQEGVLQVVTVSSQAWLSFGVPTMGGLLWPLCYRLWPLKKVLESRQKSQGFHWMSEKTEAEDGFQVCSGPHGASSRVGSGVDPTVPWLCDPSKPLVLFEPLLWYCQSDRADPCSPEGAGAPSAWCLEGSGTAGGIFCSFSTGPCLGQAHMLRSCVSNSSWGQAALARKHRSRL